MVTEQQPRPPEDDEDEDEDEGISLEKAIEILEDEHGELDPAYGQDFTAAYKLGIEALKAINSVRNGIPATIFSLLPGETKGIKRREVKIVKDDKTQRIDV